MYGYDVAHKNVFLLIYVSYPSNILHQTNSVADEDFHFESSCQAKLRHQLSLAVLQTYRLSCLGPMASQVYIRSVNRGYILGFNAQN